MEFRAAMLAVLAVLVLLLCAVDETMANPHKTADAEPKRARDIMRKLSPSNHYFSSALYKELSKQEGNIFFSPFSIHTVLSIASLGSGGITKKQFEESMKLPSKKEVQHAYKNLIQKLEFTGDVNVVVKAANKIYTNTQYELNEQFKRDTHEFFSTEAESVDFGSRGDAVADQINAWVEEKTNHRIKDLIAKGSLDADTAMVLVNAIYFKGKWATEFVAADTVEKPFHLNKDKKVNVPMMHLHGEFNYKDFDELDAKVLELNYAGNRLSMLIILPNKVDGLSDLERKLTIEGKLTDVLKLTSYGRPEVNIRLPRFKMEQSAELTEVLQHLGMTSMFGDNANFTGMLAGNAPGLKISEVAHKAFIEVDEEGSEAAAATMYNVQTLSINYDDKPCIFHANHPFVFVIRHKPSTHALFVGRYSGPQD